MSDINPSADDVDLFADVAQELYGAPTEPDPVRAPTLDLAEEKIDEAIDKVDSGRREMLSETHVADDGGKTRDLGDEWADDGSAEFIDSLRDLPAKERVELGIEGRPALSAEQQSEATLAALGKVYADAQARYGDDLDPDELVASLSDEHDSLQRIEDPAARLKATIDRDVAWQHVLNGDYAEALQALDGDQYLLADLRENWLGESDVAAMDQWLGQQIQEASYETYANLAEGIEQAVRENPVLDTDTGIAWIQQILEASDVGVGTTPEQAKALGDAAARAANEVARQSRLDTFYEAFDDATWAVGGYKPEGNELWGRPEKPGGDPAVARLQAANEAVGTIPKSEAEIVAEQFAAAAARDRLAQNEYFAPAKRARERSAREAAEEALRSVGGGR